MNSAKRQEAQSPARPGGVGAMGHLITAQIRDEVVSWEGVTTASHRFGGIEFRVGRHELGHLHGHRLPEHHRYEKTQAFSFENKARRRCGRTC